MSSTSKYFLLKNHNPDEGNLQGCADFGVPIEKEKKSILTSWGTQGCPGKNNLQDPVIWRLETNNQNYVTSPNLNFRLL